MSIIEFLDQHNGSLMVIITFIYVVATAMICWANIRSAKASRDQLAKSQQQLVESRKQFDESQAQIEETRRLEYMPFLQLEMPIEHQPPLFELDVPIDSITDWRGYKIVRIKNLGNGTATNLVYEWECEDIKEVDTFPICAIMKGDSYYFQLFTFGDSNRLKTTKGTLSLGFDDLLGMSYEQKMTLIIENNVLSTIEVGFPRYRGIVTYSLPKENESETDDSGEKIDD